MFIAQQSSLIDTQKIGEIVSTINLTTHQQKYLEDFITRYNQKTKISKQLSQAHRPFLADNKTFVDFHIPLKEIFYPIVTNRSSGCKIWDVDGNEYIDLVMGFGVNLFGHNPPFIKEALAAQLEKGIQLGSQAEIIGEVAQLICELTGMERVAFSNTGTEAIMTAIRMARTVTGRKKIVIFSNSYHGHFDGTLGKVKIIDDNLQTVPIALGIPSSFVEDILVLKYGEQESIEAIANNAQDIAAVLVEPVQKENLDLQPQAFLQQLRKLTKESGIALIFDEMVTGFRIHPGGAQAWFGIEADIAAYGKIVGGGIAIGIIAGKANFMDAIDGGMWNYGDLSSPDQKTTFFAGTYCKHPLALAAAKAVLEHLKTQSFTLQNQLNQRTTKFVKTLNNYFDQERLPIQLTNFGSLFGPVYSENDSEEDAGNPDISLAYNLLYYHLLDQGIMLRGNGGFLSTAHTDEDINQIIQAVKNSISKLREGEFLP
ncbi:aminotransferase class III-fold pyridoxal phosphate-dependent enzyme [Nostoc sp. XA010]|uniref:aminotransferase class III-fold pyridoxal phosphate-dependent enzyme n=1 Tax=Nostoc sp. XA010 TaxID=2780407 RepID=UPI001E604AD7|nr:aminotransferase class III-fold pyridoxal phosphate-dependent enzyme [Nostoc sp. XA010]MCC5658377.1 aminotransferase class III-fold pyridoxal phosphate-dependent enzyme [Nostoc sp. XA010]